MKCLMGRRDVACNVLRAAFPSFYVKQGQWRAAHPSLLLPVFAFDSPAGPTNEPLGFSGSNTLDSSAKISNVIQLGG